MELRDLSDVCRYLRAKGRAISVGRGDLVQFAYPHGAQTVPIAMRQLVFASGSSWLGLSIAIGPIERFRPRAALVASAALPVGVLALFEDMLLLRQTLPLASLAVGPFEQTLRALVSTAVSVATGAHPYLFR